MEAWKIPPPVWRGCVNSACFLDVIWYEAVKEILGEEEGIEGEADESE